jgi:hypothetical protein
MTAPAFPPTACPGITTGEARASVAEDILRRHGSEGPVEPLVEIGEPGGGRDLPALLLRHLDAAGIDELQDVFCLALREARLAAFLLEALDEGVRGPTWSFMSMAPVRAAKRVRYGLASPVPGVLPESMTAGARSKPGWSVRMTSRHLAASTASGQTTSRNAYWHRRTRRTTAT